MLAFLESLSLESRRLRFFTPALDLEAAARWAADADGMDRIGLIAIDSQGRIVGHAVCARLYGRRGEVAVEVAEDHRHLGLASLLLRQVAHDAERQGIRTLVAEVLPDNHEMLAVFHDEFQAGQRASKGEVDVEFPSASWHAAPHRAPPGRGSRDGVAPAGASPPGVARR
jgi:GNAT superfamily N-acetyltransferase